MTSRSDYRSGLEYKIAKNLDSRGVKFGYEQESFLFIAPLKKNKIMCNQCQSTDILQQRSYTPDFFINDMVIEAKGRWTADGRLIAKAIKDQYPNMDYRMVFERDQAIRKGSTTKYSDVCKKLDIPYAIKNVPESWL